MATTKRKTTKKRPEKRASNGNPAQTLYNPEIAQVAPSATLLRSLERLQAQGVPFVTIAELKPWDRNPRANAAAVPGVVESMQRFGWTNPVLVREADAMVEAGHTRLLAANVLGLLVAPAIRLEHSREDAEMYALADNRLAEVATWDDEALAEVLAELDESDRAIVGWDEDDYADLLDRVVDADEKEASDDPWDNRVTFGTAPPGMVGFRFGDYRGYVPQAVYNTFRTQYEARKADGSEVMLGDVLATWMGER